MIRRLQHQKGRYTDVVARAKGLLQQVFSSNRQVWKTVLLVYVLLSLWMICMTILTIPLFLPIIIILLVIIPIIVIYLRWKQIQHELSQEIYMIIPLFSSHYRMNGDDLIRTLHFTVESIKHEQLQQIFVKIVHFLQLNLPQDQFKHLVQDFVLLLRHAYTLRFFVLIQKAHYGQANIAHALTQLAEDVQGRKKDLEAEISQTQDTRLMGLLPLVTLPLSLLFTYHISSLIDYAYLFMLPQNLLIFCMALLFSIMSIVLSFLLKQPQTDY